MIFAWVWPSDARHSLFYLMDWKRFWIFSALHFEPPRSVKALFELNIVFADQNSDAEQLSKEKVTQMSKWERKSRVGLTSLFSKLAGTSFSWFTAKQGKVKNQSF